MRDGKEGDWEREMGEWGWNLMEKGSDFFFVFFWGWKFVFSIGIIKV